jgi:hypothetical protein
VRHHRGHEHEAAGAENRPLLADLDLDLALLDEQDLLQHVDVAGSGLAGLELDAEHRRARVAGRPEHREGELRLHVGDGSGVQLDELVQVRADLIYAPASASVSDARTAAS